MYLICHLESVVLLPCIANTSVLSFFCFFVFHIINKENTKYTFPYSKNLPSFQPLHNSVIAKSSIFQPKTRFFYLFCAVFAFNNGIV